MVVAAMDSTLLESQMINFSIDLGFYGRTITSILWSCGTDDDHVCLMPPMWRIDFSGDKGIDNNGCLRDPLPSKWMDESKSLHS